MKKALVIGINKYPDAPLLGCVKDAEEMAHLLERNGDGSKNFDVRLETALARRHKLREHLVKLFAGDHETALFYFSGHGLVNDLGGYLVTPDHTPYDEGVSMYEILALANQSRCKNKIIILDCCYSGAINQPEPSPTLSGFIREGMTLFTASRANETAAEVNGHGMFTNLLLEALKGGAADVNGYITPGSVYAYVDQAFGSWEQRPAFKSNVSRYTPLRSVPSTLPLPTLQSLTTLFPTPDADFHLAPSYEYTNVADVDGSRPPYAEPEHVALFKELQKLASAGLVRPVDEEHMYMAAMRSGICRLTPLGAHYWRLVAKNRI